MAWGKTEGQKAQDADAKAAARAAKEQDKAREAEAKAAARAAKDEEQARAAYFASPVGQADQAKSNGARFFQVEIPHKSIRGFANAMWATNTHQRQVAHAGAPDVLGQIEALGWHLDHASWVFMKTGQSSRDKFLASGQQTVVSGEVVGIYLFRSVN